MSATPSNALLIFIKNPIKGNVKTRLAASVGNEQALQIYKTLLDYTRGVTLKVEAHRRVCYSRFIDEHDEWDLDYFDKKVQQGTSLGARMKHAFKQAFADGHEQAVIIGSDCGQLEAKHINQAFEALQHHQVVVGPAQDGGYYLLGMNRLFPVLFDDKPWSTESVLEQTLADCREHDLSYHVLEQLNDVDTEADWEQVKEKF